MKDLATASLLAIFLFAAKTSAADPSNPPSTAKPTTNSAEQGHMDHSKMDNHADHGKQDGMTGEFATLDANKDGKLSKAELSKHKLGPHFDMLDADKSGTLSPTEFAAGKSM